jgi:hypothetical protein
MVGDLVKLKKPRGAFLRMIRAGMEIPGYMTLADLERDERKRKAAKELRELEAASQGDLFK